MFNYFVFENINQFAGKYLWLDTLGIFFAKYLGYFLVLFLILFLIRNFRKYWPMISRAFGAGILSRLIITEIIRFLYPVSRPFIGNNINLLFNYSATSSFPSGHAAFYFALSTTIYFYNKKTGFLFLVASFLISISRVFVGVHWPLDVLAGAIVGIFSAWLIIYVLNRVKHIEQY